MALLLGFAHDFDVGPKVIEGRGDLLLACGEVLAQDFFADAEALVQVQFRDLLGEASLDVIHSEAASAGVLRLDDVEKMGVFLEN